jgi:thymidylate kinase
MEIAERVDRAVTSRVLVFGSLPPGGRDLDLLARPQEERELARNLAAAGFVAIGHHWAQFRACSAQVVEVVPATAWRLPPAELEALFEQAKLLPEMSQLARPAPHHALLILARRLAHAGGTLDDRRRRRIDAALAEDPDAWTAARESAGAWRARSALAALESAYATGSPVGRFTRALARWEGEGRAMFGRKARRRRRAILVTFSGLDGSGKSTQCHALCETLHALGMPAIVEWMSVVANPSLGPIAAPVKASLRLLQRRSRRDEPAATSDGLTGRRPTHEIRARSGVVAVGWTTVVTFATALWHVRTVGRHLLAGRTVICDRYVLDSSVHLRYTYGEGRSFRWQGRLLKLISPPPKRSYFLDVAPDVAYARNQEYEPDEIVKRARLYREENEWVRARRLDGSRTAAELCADVATDVLSLLA